MRASLSTRLPFARELRGLTQDRLSELSGVAQPGICSYEHGREPRLWALLRVAHGLMVDPAWLLGAGDVGSPPPDPAALVELTCLDEAELAEWMAERVGAERTRRGWSQRQLAKACDDGLTQQRDAAS